MKICFNLPVSSNLDETLETFSDGGFKCLKSESTELNMRCFRRAMRGIRKVQCEVKQKSLLACVAALPSRSSSAS